MDLPGILQVEVADTIKYQVEDTNEKQNYKKEEHLAEQNDSSLFKK